MSLVHSSRVQSFKAGWAWWQKLEMVGHTASTAGKQRGDASSLSSFRSAQEPMEGAVCILGGFSLLVRLPRNMFTDVLMALLLDSKAHQDAQ